ncbi:amino acid permease [Neisseriaceae bacterium PsAf]|nr:amino acid permease [Neisseriaceae bacterium PsAf]
MIPKAGSVGTYSLVALGQLPSMMSVFCGYVIVAMFALSSEMVLMTHVLSHVLNISINTLALGFVVVTIFAVLNLFKIDVFAKLQSILAFGTVCYAILLGIDAIYGAKHTSEINSLGPLVNNDFSWTMLGLVTLGFWVFCGIEFVCPLVEETKNPNKNIPRSMYLSLGLLFLMFCIYGTGAVYTLPKEVLITSAVPHLDYGMLVLGQSAKYLIAVFTILAACSSLNITIVAVSRMLYGMAKNTQVLPPFKYLSKKNNVPWVGVLFVAYIILIPLFIFHTNSSLILVLAAASTVSWLIAYLINHINVIAMRFKYPNMHRPYKVPFYPLPQIIGILGMIYAICHVSQNTETAKEIYFYAGWIIGIVAVLSVLWIKLVMKKPLFESEPLEVLTRE